MMRTGWLLRVLWRRSVPSLLRAAALLPAASVLVIVLVTSCTASTRAPLNSDATRATSAGGSDMHGSDLNGSDMDGADMDGADMDGADMDGSDLAPELDRRFDGDRGARARSPDTSDAPLGSSVSVDHRARSWGRRDEGRPPFTGPRVAEVVAAAYGAAGLDGGLPGFARRARLGGLVPAVSVRTGRDASWHDEDPDVGRGTTLEIRATWRLDRLVFDGRELQVVALEAARRRERRRLATQVIRTYYVWKRSGSRALEAAAELDALTNGWFSETTQRGASETRTFRDGPAATP